MNLGDADRSDPLLGCLSKPTPAPTPAPTPTSATTLDGRNIAPPSPSPAAAETPTPIQKHYPDYQIVIEADVRLQGIPLPEFTGRVKVLPPAMRHREGGRRDGEGGGKGRGEERHAVCTLVGAPSSSTASALFPVVISFCATAFCRSLAPATSSSTGTTGPA